MAETTPKVNKDHRPPVVVVLGHVDHGKTTLLDTIRKAAVAASESGGITQHIGAYQVDVNSKLITFLDTPGHEAFTAIRSRGAKVADIAILVVAADESIKPQTKEAIQIIKEAKIPFIVAINKIDKDGANVQKVKQDLATEDVLVEDWGGQIPAVEISAKKDIGIPALLDMILLVADLEELEEDLSSPAEGIIIESNLDKQRGYVATVLVQKGVIHLNDWIVAGAVVGKIRSIESFTSEPITQALPSQPVRITGWPAAPDIGKKFKTADNKDGAHRIQEENVDLNPLFSFFRSTDHGATKEEPDKHILNIIFKTDVLSSLEAIEASIKAIKSDEVGYRAVGYDIGNIGEADVKKAVSTGSIIIGFRVDVVAGARKLAERDNVKISTFDVIYELIQYVRDQMADLLPAEIQKNVTGKLRVLKLFKREGKNQILGGKVTSGKMVRGSLVDRDGVRVGKMNQLQQNKEDATEVREGVECGMKIEVANPDIQFKEGDTLEMYEEEKIKRSL